MFSIEEMMASNSVQDYKHENYSKDFSEDQWSLVAFNEQQIIRCSAKDKLLNFAPFSDLVKVYMENPRKPSSELYTNKQQWSDFGAIVDVR